jgi:hypothetical protein
MATEVSHAVLQRAREHGRLIEGAPYAPADRPPWRARRASAILAGGGGAGAAAP